MFPESFVNTFSAMLNDQNNSFSSHQVVAFAIRGKKNKPHLVSSSISAVLPGDADLSRSHRGIKNKIN